LNRRTCSAGVGNHHPFEFIYLVVTPLPCSLAGKTLHPLDQDAPIPGAVEHNDLPGVRQLFPKPLQVVSAALVRSSISMTSSARRLEKFRPTESRSRKLIRNKDIAVEAEEELALLAKFGEFGKPRICLLLGHAFASNHE
jgi:hypothetical protein